MNIVCLDLEGVLVPEIWIAFAKETGIPELEKTTRDEPDYDKLMNYRINILKEHGLGLKEIQETIAKIDPMPGAKEFLDELRSITQVIIISDTFSQFAGPLMKKLGWPTIFCNVLEVAEDGESHAVTLGVKSKMVRLVLILLSLLLVAFATSVTGPIASVAFLAGPIAARLCGGGRTNMLSSALVGSVLVLASDLIGQFALPSRYPVGVVTGILGAPYLIFLLLRMNKKSEHV